MTLTAGKFKTTFILLSLVIPVFLFPDASSPREATRLPAVWTDPATGYAIGGYDPVAYFVRGKAVFPNTRIEAFQGAVNWRFANIGNRQAFLDHPEVYTPQFGGMDPVQLAKGKHVFGNPTLFDVYRGRLYLFYNGVTLSRWRYDRAGFVRRARKAWPRAARRQRLDVGTPQF